MPGASPSTPLLGVDLGGGAAGSAALVLGLLAGSLVLAVRQLDEYEYAVDLDDDGFDDDEAAFDLDDAYDD